MGKINILSKEVAEKIAAGEVVERPGSIVKELTENSFDAGASSVTVEIERGGVSYIRVTDNGSGIMKDDVERAFMRHATSKIKDAGDLEKIQTLGFRGEALCSIGAVSRTELITKTALEEIGSRILIEGGETIDLDDAGCPTGTTVTVKNLFYNTPARMKFMKKDSTEAGIVTEICQRAAISHPEVSFRFIRDGREIFFTPGDNIIRNAVRAVFGKDVAAAMADVDKTIDGFHVKGLTGKNNLSRPNRNMQFFFVNGRLVKSAVLSLAMSEAYKNELMTGRFPVCFLDIELLPENVDVNVHPAKTEIKFADDEAVYRALCLIVRETLSAVAMPREAMWQAEKAYRMPIETKTAPQAFFKSVKAEDFLKEQEKKSLFKKTEKIKQRPNAADAGKTASSVEELPEKKIEALSVREEYIASPQIKEEVLRTEKQEAAETHFKVVGQLFSTYILLETDDKMIMIDQHAAHERINYEKIKNDGCMKQMLLMPITAAVSAREKAAWEENRDFFEKLGFEADDFGNGSVLIRTLPSDIDFADGEALFIEIASTLLGTDKGEVTKEREKAVYTVACKAAIKANAELSEEEMRSLAEKALAMEGISTCPHGRPISVEFTKYKIDKMFKRIV